jgi:ferredoxin-NADP reductase/multimeric flavodoxin WrbA
MRTVILNGAQAAHDPTDRVATALEARLARDGASVRHYILRDQSIGHCLGDFDCWVRTPGRCRIKDEGQEIERAVHDAAILAFVSPVTFGGYGAQLKKAKDRLIPLILPFFAKRADMTHHALRYQHLPAMIGIGIDADGSAHRTHVFSALVESNALNLGAPTWASVVLGTDEATWGAGLSLALKPGQAPGNASGSAQGARDFLAAMLASDPLAAALPLEPRVALLVASARPAGESTSLAIAQYLAHQLESHEAQVEIVMAHAFARDAATANHAAASLARADVLGIVSPLYVDTLPYLAILALQRTQALRAQAPTPQRVIGIINSGFPEPEQSRFAFATLREFAREAGSYFAGGLSIGGGEAIKGQDLVKAGGRTIVLRKAIDQAAVALAAGGVIPYDVSMLTAKPSIPPFLYRFGGFMQWTFAARGNHLTSEDLKSAPFDQMTDDMWEREAASGSARARPLRVIGKRPENGDAVTVLFEDPAHDPLTYEAGQYITLDLEIDGVRVRRAYSLASAPDEPGLAITVKRVPGGQMSNHIHDALQVGDVVRSHGPSGHFVTGEAQNILLFGGGSGIVPLAAMARTVLRNASDARVTLVYGASSKTRAIYAEALDALAAEAPERFALHWVLEAPDAEWRGARGRLDEAGIGALLDGLQLDAFDAVMLCGPDAMRGSVRAMATARGVDEKRIAEESFTSPRAAPASIKEEVATLTTDEGAVRAIAVAPGKTLLEAALDAGEAISFSCMSGGCGACRVTVTDGLQNIVMDEPNDVSVEDRARGVLPACLCRLTGAISFQVGVP